LFTFITFVNKLTENRFAVNSLRKDFKRAMARRLKTRLCGTVPDSSGAMSDNIRAKADFDVVAR
jgi:hypothetical protein